jgi:hypothetical protein
MDPRPLTLSFGAVSAPTPGRACNDALNPGTSEENPEPIKHKVRSDQIIDRLHSNMRDVVLEI